MTPVMVTADSLRKLKEEREYMKLECALDFIEQNPSAGWRSIRQHLYDGFQFKCSLSLLNQLFGDCPGLINEVGVLDYDKLVSIFLDLGYYCQIWATSRDQFRIMLESPVGDQNQIK